MKSFLILLFSLATVTTYSQVTDSAWLVNEYLPKFYVDTGTSLPNKKFFDEHHQEKTLANYRGKILYVDVWATWCGNCLIKFPHQEQLLKRLRAIHLDSLIQLVNINIDDSRQKWQSAIRKYHPIGINLYSSDIALLANWNIESLPAYILLDSSGKVLGKDICGPDEAGITDYILYSAAKGIHPTQALWKVHEQDKLMEKYKTSDAFTDKDYADWFKMTIQSFLEYQQWRQNRQRKNSR